MAIVFQNYYGCSRIWNLLLYRANTLKIKSSQRGFVKTGSSGFWTRKFRISTVISLFGPWLTLSPLIHSLTYCPTLLLFGRGDFVAIQESDQGFQGTKVGPWWFQSRGSGSTLRNRFQTIPTMSNGTKSFLLPDLFTKDWSVRFLWQNTYI